MAPKIILAYWKIRGLTQPIRMLLGYLGEDFEDRTYECGDFPTFDKSCWFDVKETLGFDFPNLPYLIDGDMKITQSNAILRYLGRKHSMDGKTEMEKIRVDILENQAMDFTMGYVGLVYRSDPAHFTENLEKYRIKAKDHLERFNNFISDRKYFAGEELTYVDFMMYERLLIHRMLDSTLLEPFEKLLAFMKRFQEVPGIATFMNSDECFSGPINNKYAIWGR